jgi:hypothetical protein
LSGQRFFWWKSVLLTSLDSIQNEILTVWVEPDKRMETKEKNPAALIGLNPKMIEIHSDHKSLEVRAILCLSNHGICIKPLHSVCALTLNPELKKDFQIYHCAHAKAKPLDEQMEVFRSSLSEYLLISP